MKISTNMFKPGNFTYGTWWVRFGRAAFILKAPWSMRLYGERNGGYKAIIRLGFGWRVLVRHDDIEKYCK